MSVFHFILDQLMVGNLVSDCRVPCVETISKVLAGPSSIQDMDYKAVYFYITSDIDLQEVVVDEFDFMESLNFLGSNLGLWPGMGLFQILEGALLIFAGYNLSLKLRNFFSTLFCLNTKLE